MNWAFIAPGLRPRKGPRIGTNKSTGRTVAHDKVALWSLALVVCISFAEDFPLEIKKFG